MEDLNIPIGRGLILGTKDEYIEGTLFGDKTMCFIIPTGNISVWWSREIEESINIIHKTKVNTSYEVDPTTIAVHFPDMLAKDSDRWLANGEKDLRIFASLSEDGKGGDIIHDNRHRDRRKLFYNGLGFCALCLDIEEPLLQNFTPLFLNNSYYEGFKVIGIQE